MFLSPDLAERILGFDAACLDRLVLDAARRAVTDTVGVLLLGAAVRRPGGSARRTWAS